jgi:Asp-tRNAAsn/Glu-tRNAGln amidotransferase A subunit and related amidases
MTLLEAARAFRSGSVSSVELTRECLRRIEKLQPALNAFLTVTGESALAEAGRMDRERREGMDRGPLHGIPVAHKDLLCTKGIVTTGGSPLFADYIPNFDATAVERLREAGAVLVGKTHLHELAYGITSNNPHYGPARNPWDPRRIPGGSSGGSAIAVATGMAMLATGTDSGGSIRVPAAFCSVTGLKPTYGRVSRFGVLPLAFSLDHVGPIARTVRDCALALSALAGPDSRDPSCSPRPVPAYLPPPEPDLKGIRIGVPENFFYEKVEAVIDNAVHFMAYRSEDLGAQLVPVRVPDGAQLNAIAQITLLAEAAAVHEPYLRRKANRYSPEVRALLDMGRMLSATDYLQAQRLRARIRGVYGNLLRDVDCLLVPATPVLPPLIGQQEVEINGQVEDTRLAVTRLVRGVNALGLPALAMPAGFTGNGLPVGMQLIGRPFDEALLLRIGAALEDATGHVRRNSPML